MRLFQSSSTPPTNGLTVFEQYLGNMSEALVRMRAEKDIRDAREAAECALRMRSAFLENMNHELRTPLNAIIGFASMLRDEAAFGLSSEQKQNYTDYIIQSADLLLGHINTILEVAALDNGSVEPSHEAVDASDLLSSALDRINVRATSAGIKVLCRAVDSKGNQSQDIVISEPLWADRERVGQSLDHLLQTAIKSCGQDSKVLIRVTEQNDGWVDIQIRDDGEGFTDEDLDEALNAFQAEHRGLSQPFTGPGVGIAIAKTFIEMQGGEFSIKSRKGKGTLSTVRLPLLSTATKTTTEPVDASEDQQQSTVSVEAQSAVYAKSA